MPKKLISFNNEGIEKMSIDVDGNMSFKSMPKSTSNMRFHYKNQYTVLTSYDTPVAAYDTEKCICYITEKKWSQTTTKHIHKAVSKIKSLKETIKVPQKTIDDIYKYGKSESLIDKKDRFENLIID